MQKKIKAYLLGMFIVVILQLLLSCGTTKTIEYKIPVTADDIPDFPVLNYYAESEDGMYITVDSYWFVEVGKYKLEIDSLKEVLKKCEREIN